MRAIMATVYRVEYDGHFCDDTIVHLGTYSSIVKSVARIKEHAAENWDPSTVLLPLNEAEIGDYGFGFKVVDPSNNEVCAQYNVSAYVLNEAIEELL